jgi:hypothetical protein
MEVVTFEELANRYSVRISAIKMILCRSEFINYVKFSPKTEGCIFYADRESIALLERCLKCHLK